MNLEEMKSTIAHMEADFDAVRSPYSKRAIRNAFHDIKKKIEEEEARLNKKLDTRIIDGVEIEIPASMNEYNRLNFHAHEGILYLIERKKKFTKDEHPHLSIFSDTEFHWFSYAWIPNGNKFSKLCVRMIGGDAYGDRVFTSAQHYKHPADQFGYMETHLKINSPFYRPYVEHILQEVTGWTLKYLKKN